SSSYSSAEPSHQWTSSGWVSSVTRSTQASSFWWVVGAVVACVTGFRVSLCAESEAGKGISGPPYTAARASGAAFCGLGDDGQRDAPHRRRRDHPAVAGAGLRLRREPAPAGAEDRVRRPASAGYPATAPEGRCDSADRDSG